jgi:cytoskeletal protein RodZ
MTDEQSLAARIQQAMERACISLDQLAARTKVPRSTLRVLLGEDSGLAPARVYLRGHLGLIARELGVDVEEMLNLFDARYPEVADEHREVVEISRAKSRASTVAIGAGLAGVGLLAVILSLFG